jgi:LAS superfamily LD-carboxypeptidase LdcB
MGTKPVRIDNRKRQKARRRRQTAAARAAVLAAALVLVAVLVVAGIIRHHKKTQTVSQTENCTDTVQGQQTSQTEAAGETLAGTQVQSVTAKGYAIQVVDGVTYIGGMMIANKSYSLPESYAPGDLLPEVKEAFAVMQKAAAAQGLNIYISSGYRSYSRQQTL